MKPVRLFESVFEPAGRGPVKIWKGTNCCDNLAATGEDLQLVNLKAADSKIQVTLLLKAWRGGDNAALDDLIGIVYHELKKRAHAQMRRESPAHVLETTGLVHEAYVRLVEGREVSWQDRAHFFAVAAQKMRQILVDYARAQARQKRGGDLQWTSMSDGLAVSIGRSEDLLALDEALSRLAATSPRKAKAVELRFFGGLSVEEAAEVLGVSAETVKLDWRFAKAWLHRQLSSGGESHGLEG
jgi:RNA polymerase sigma factor (TIGR02999 family)